MAKGIIAFLTLGSLAACSFGQVTGLVTIPTADTIGPREIEFGHSVSGTEHAISKQYSHSAYLLAGLHDRFEIAGATDFLGGQTWGFKFVPYRSADGKYAIGIGAQNINGGQSDLFAMARANFGPANLHAGWTRDSDHRGLVGLDFSIDRWTFGLDHSGNADGATNFGVWYDLGQGFTLFGSFSRPNMSSEPEGHSFMLIYGTRF